MKIQFNTDKTTNGDEKHKDYFSSLIEENLGRFDSHITRIEVHISNKNGEKDGLNGKLCLLEARLKARQPITVTCDADTKEKAVSGAIDKLKASLETILGKLQNY